MEKKLFQLMLVFFIFNGLQAYLYTKIIKGGK